MFLNLLVARPHVEANARTAFNLETGLLGRLPTSVCQNAVGVLPPRSPPSDSLRAPRLPTKLCFLLSQRGAARTPLATKAKKAFLTCVEAEERDDVRF